MYASNVVIGREIFSEFYYYLVPENKRQIALLGEDFLDNSTDNHAAHANIQFTDFDFAKYNMMRTDTISNQDIISLSDRHAPAEHGPRARPYGSAYIGSGSGAVKLCGADGEGSHKAEAGGGHSLGTAARQEIQEMLRKETGVI